MQFLYKKKPEKIYLLFHGVMVSMLASGAVDHGFKP